MRGLGRSRFPLKRSTQFIVNAAHGQGHISTHFGLRSLIVPLAGAIGISIVHWLLSWRLSSERLAKRLKTPYPILHGIATPIALISSLGL